MEKISVVIPIYKVEKYLNQCIESVIHQSYKNLEIILVDDGSPDNCPAICEEWARKDERVKVIHQENAGLSAARNAGLELATGEYILFVDSDDYIAVTMCEDLLRVAQENQADLVSCNFCYVYEDGSQEDSPLDFAGKNILSYNSQESIYTYFIERPIDFTVAWNKLYKKSLFEGRKNGKKIRYPLGKLHEDEFTSYKLYYEAEKTVRLAKALYYYRQRSGSIMATITEKNMQAIVDFCQEYLRWSQNKAIPMKQLCINGVLLNYLGLWGRTLEEEKFSLQPYIKEMGKILAKEKIYPNPYISVKGKIKYTLQKLHVFLPLLRIKRWFQGKS